MKGIVLAGGAGTRLYPLTMAASKQILPIYDKPMIYYPLSTLMLAGIRDILIISTPRDLPLFEKLLGNGDDLGIRLSYKEQKSPDGIAQAFIIGKEFIADDACALILGDNIFYGHGFSEALIQAAKDAEDGKSTIFGYYVDDPKRFGVIGFDDIGQAVSVEEKPENPKSNYCVTGLYFYNNKVTEYAEKIKLSARGELEITSVNNMYIEDKSMKVHLLGRGFTWFDTGTIDSMMEASEFIRRIENNNRLKIAVLEEIAYYKKWINREKLIGASERYGKSPYGIYLRMIAENKIY